MSPETRSKALEKLAKFTPKIGYPDKWRDYSKLEIRRDDLVGNVRRATAFELARNLAKLGKPVDRDEWVHDAADGQRLLQPGDERDRLPRRDPPAAVLRPGGRRRGELRRHRRGDRPRDRPRLRRPGLEVRRRRQPGQLVDRRRPQGVRGAHQDADRAVQRASSRPSFPARRSTARSRSARTSATSAAWRSPTRPTSGRSRARRPR